jgi:hypothetical protein
MDFTISTYCTLIRSLILKQYCFKTFEDFLYEQGTRTIILRHDVDGLPENSLKFALIQQGLGIRSTFYFRSRQISNNKELIARIASCGHEIGYHYEDLAVVSKRHPKKKEQEIVKYALESFEKNLNKLREIAAVKTICMHGSPLNKWDNRLMWKYCDYHIFDVTGEPYFDINFNEVLYLTDTGRTWHGERFNVRDKIPSNIKTQFTGTLDIIRASEEQSLPEKIMMTFHPQRWTDNLFLWTKELIFQNIKNSIKYVIVKQSKTY